ncbi:MAG: endonuclease V [Halobacteriota archaeon]
MEVARSEYLPDPALERAGMESLQRAIADDASFVDDGRIDPSQLTIDEPLALPDGDLSVSPSADASIVVGVDQAFTEETAVSVAIAIQDGRVVDRSVGREPLQLPYIPGLLAFREAGAIVDALEGLAVAPTLLVLDGSGRLHFRQAGIATHVGVVFDVPAIGVAKSLLCGRPARSLADPLPAGTRVPILADESVDADPETVIGHAYQSRQFSHPERRHVNPLFVSPGHRISAETTVEAVGAFSAGYKLPEPTRLADRAVDVCKD